MDTLMIECLRCGDVREVPTSDGAKVDAGECHRCDYVGWALVADLTGTYRAIWLVLAAILAIALVPATLVRESPPEAIPA